MSDERPRRYKERHAPEPPSGYRQSRRGTGALKAARRAERQHKMITGWERAWRTFKNVLFVIVQAIALVVVTAIVLLLVANVVNMVVRWDAQRKIAHQQSQEGRAEAARENILIIGVREEKAVGYLAMRIDAKGDQVFGIAVSEGAFVDIPGRGFSQIGEAYSAGPDIAMSTVSNYFTVPFESYIVVPEDVYKTALTEMTVSALPGASVDTNLTDRELAAISKELATIEHENVAIVPMPVKPLKLGEQTYYEPQRAEIADLLRLWWGVDATKGEEVTRVIVYNGAGKPGIAGEAAQFLIRAGLRVIDTKNADSFDYKKTQIVVKRGTAERGDEIRQALGVGEVKVETSTADVTDVIVIIGKDYKPKEAEEEKK